MSASRRIMAYLAYLLNYLLSRQLTYLLISLPNEYVFSTASWVQMALSPHLGHKNLRNDLRQSCAELAPKKMKIAGG